MSDEVRSGYIYMPRQHLVFFCHVILYPCWFSFLFPILFRLIRLHRNTLAPESSGCFVGISSHVPLFLVSLCGGSEATKVVIISENKQRNTVFIIKTHQMEGYFSEIDVPPMDVVDYLHSLCKSQLYSLFASTL